MSRTGDALEALFAALAAKAAEPEEVGVPG